MMVITETYAKLFIDFYVADLDVDVLQDEEDCEDRHYWSHLLELSCDDVHEYV